ncbi:MAG: cytochrome c [Bacteroidota bacterium]|nr:cytochrome c [Bacteroidota bacterium]
MKHLFIILLSVTCVVVSTSCDSVKRKPGTIYMPDMAYSRSYQTYIERDSTQFTEDQTKADAKIFYDNRPVLGTVMRGEDLTFLVTKDLPGDTANYVASKAIQNPFSSPSAADLHEAERLFLINCAICHGPALDGNGPLYKGGQGPFPAKPAQLVGDAKYEAMPAGQMFYSVAYGKNLMGSYASQLTRQQRWMIISYIKSKQAANKPKPSSDSTTTTKM